MSRYRNYNRNNKYTFFKFLLLIVILFGVYYIDRYNIFNNEKKENAIEVTTDNKLRVYFIDVGQGDSILLTYNNHNMLIDSGNYNDRFKLTNYFKSLGINKFDYVIGTHAHEDHIGSMSYIIKNFDIDHYIMPSTEIDYNSYTYTIKALNKKNMKVEEPTIDSKIKLEDLSCDIIYYDNNKDDLNNNSIIMKCTFFNNSYLFTGDTTNDIEHKILDKDIKSDVLKVAHHGSRYSSSAIFLEKVNPKYAIITCEKDNEYGYPHKVTLDKFNTLNTKVYRTDINGTIISTSDGNNISFKTIKTNTNG